MKKLILLIYLFLQFHLVVESVICTCNSNEKCCVYYTDNPYGIHTKCCPGSSNCCGSECCDPIVHVCCGNKCYEKNSYSCCGNKACHHNMTCCHGVSTVCCDPLVEICCDGKCYNKNDYVCCETNSVCPINLKCINDTYWSIDHMRHIQKCCPKYYTACPSRILASFYNNCCPTFYPIFWLPITIFTISTLVVVLHYCFCSRNNDLIIESDEVGYQTLYGSFNIMKKIKVDNDYTPLLKPYAYKNINALKNAIIGIANWKFRNSSYLLLLLALFLFSLGILMECHFLVIILLVVLLCLRIFQFLLCWLRLGWLRCNYLHYTCFIITTLILVTSIGVLFFDINAYIQASFPGIVVFSLFFAPCCPQIIIEENYDEIMITTGCFVAASGPLGYSEISERDTKKIHIDDYLQS